MNIRQAILAAADHIERNPLAFDYRQTRTDGDPSTGCPMVWMGRFLGHESAHVCDLHRDVFGATDIYTYDADKRFSNEMDALAGTREWISKHDLAAKTFRLYADKYHPAERKPMVLPNWSAMSAQRTMLPDAVSEDVRV